MDYKKIRKIVREELGYIDASDLKHIQEGETKNWITRNTGKAWDGVKNTGRAISRETMETVAASKILLKLVSKSEVSDDEVEFLKDQSIDLAKALALIGLQAVPGSSVGIIALEKLAQKKGITLFPKAQNIPKNKEE